jgi:uncharacterized protein DUF4157
MPERASRVRQPARRTGRREEDEALAATGVSARPAPVAGLARSGAPIADPLGGTAASQDVVSVLRSRAGRGNVLPAEVAAPIGAALDTDLSSVRIHTDAEADTVTRSVQATAFTYGTDIYFSQGSYAPGSAAGQHLLAHELSHVAQHARGTSAATASGPTIGRADDPAERDAEASATSVVSALRRSTARTVGHPTGAQPTIARLQPGTPEPALRRISVAGTDIKPYGKTGKELWAYAKDNMFSTYGTRDVFLKEFCKSDVAYASPAAFLVAFKQRLSDLGRLRDLTSLSRPAWPKEYKALLHFQGGDNIRHVVRNATLKRALLEDYEDTKMLVEDHFAGIQDGTERAGRVEAELCDRYYTMAVRLGVKLTAKGSSERIVQDIYQALYLNLGNLFAGVGGDNQLIGFAADPVEDYGRKLQAMAYQEVSIKAVYDEMLRLILISYSAVAGRARKSGTLDKLDELMGSIKQLLTARCKQWIAEVKGDMDDEDPTAPAALLAEDPIDFGANFGFDLSDERSGVRGAPQNAAHRNEVLIEVETALSGEVLPGTDELSDILAKFMALSK